MIVNQRGAHDERDKDEGAGGVKGSKIRSGLFVNHGMVGDHGHRDEECEGGGDGQQVAEAFHYFVG